MKDNQKNLDKDKVEDMIRHSDEVWSGTIPEISDEEIWETSFNFNSISPFSPQYSFREGAKWYREQLKQRK